MNNAWFNAGVNSLTWQIEIATGIPGTLEGFDLQIQGAAGATVDVSVIAGGGWNLGAPAWTGTLTAAGTGTWEPVFVDVSSAGIALNTGDLWVIQLNGNTGMGVRGEYVAPPGTPPYPQPLYLGGPGCFADCGWRIGFNTYMLSGPTPPRLGKTGTCPGPVTLSVTNATANASVAILYGLPGVFVKPSNPCMGLVLNIANPTLGGVIPTNGLGNASLSFNAPPAACGRTVQGVDLATCAPTNPIVL